MLIFLFFFAFLSVCQAFSYWDCHHYAAWPVNYTNAQEKAVIMQDWLYAWQHSRVRCQSSPEATIFDHGGLAFSYAIPGLRNFAAALEFGKVYRPGPHFLWAAHDAKNCTLNTRSLDCYTREYANCNYPNKDYVSSEPNNLSDVNTTLGQMLYPYTVADICLLGSKLEMPMIWVLGQLIDYKFRPRADVAATIQGRVDQVYKGVDLKKQSVIAVQYRAGKPDFGRKLLSLDIYMKYVEMMAKELERDGRPVAVVYLASQDNDNIFHNASYMQQTYGGNYTYRLLDMAHINGSEEVEYLVRDNLAPAELLVPEFMADIQLMANADCFIGSKSTIYLMAAMLRYARAPTRHKKYTCHVSQGMDLLCEDSWNAIDIWKYYMYPAAFRGGTAF